MWFYKMKFRIMPYMGGYSVFYKTHWWQKYILYNNVIFSVMEDASNWLEVYLASDGYCFYDQFSNGCKEFIVLKVPYLKK